MNFKKELVKDFGKDYFLNEDFFNWRELFRNRLFSEDEIDKYKDVLDWSMLIYHQPLSSSIYEKYENIFYEKCLWESTLKEQILSSEDIFRYIKNFPISDIIVYQHLTPDDIDRLIKDYLPVSQDIHRLCKFILEYQILPEDYLIEKEKEGYFYRDDIIRTQRITSKLISGLKIDINTEEDLLRRNYLYNTDIGREWFIGYAIKNNSSFNFKYFLILPKIDYKIYVSTDIIKIRVYYKDCIAKYFFKDADLIKKIGKVDPNSDNLKKRLLR